MDSCIAPFKKGTSRSQNLDQKQEQLLLFYPFQSVKFENVSPRQNTPPLTIEQDVINHLSTPLRRKVIRKPFLLHTKAIAPKQRSLKLF
uniref:Uncharacterized protein n=1 Tax=Rhizophora mucronata TaxID=61149 RepID=A0A2P2NKZ1_RHIMU